MTQRELYAEYVGLLTRNGPTSVVCTRWKEMHEDDAELITLCDLADALWLNLKHREPAT